MYMYPQSVFWSKKLSHATRKLVFGVYDQVLHKPACAATEDGKKLEISDLSPGHMARICVYANFAYMQILLT